MLQNDGELERLAVAYVQPTEEVAECVAFASLQSVWTACCLVLSN